MTLTDPQRARAANPAFPRASTYDAAFQIETMMGPNVLWLAEWASQAVPFAPGQRVLDLGCGKAASSIFLAKEFGASIWASDLWISPSENLARIEAAGLADRVVPVSAEAHALPFAVGFFDVVVSFDAYHYFGTDDLYIGYLARFLRPGGLICVISPGVAEERVDGPPDWLKPYWDWQFCSFHSPEWWRRHWAKTGLVEVLSVDWLDDGWRYWAEWDALCAEVGAGHNPAGGAREAEMLRLDAGRTLGFFRLVARKV
jgi:cyclopropane fatty-acyl-phospholipid synthase-like methyltransferase